MITAWNIKKKKAFTAKEQKEVTWTNYLNGQLSKDDTHLSSKPMTVAPTATKSE